MTRISEESQRVNIAQSEVALALHKLREEQKLTTAEFLQALTMWITQAMKWEIRVERLTDKDHEDEWPELRYALNLDQDDEEEDG